MDKPDIDRSNSAMIHCAPAKRKRRSKEFGSTSPLWRMLRLLRRAYIDRAICEAQIRRPSSREEGRDSSPRRCLSTSGWLWCDSVSRCCRICTTVSTNLPGAARPKVFVATSCRMLMNSETMSDASAGGIFVDRAATRSFDCTAYPPKLESISCTRAIPSVVIRYFLRPCLAFPDFLSWIAS